ncbi:MAG TPA: family 16 glycosylhydrolase [Actinophytocola sp.]|uniref:ricin-type beta-trefoil lectin domain protein n=1 Tax=Actinophytocola sp. TaxID=1872138 RepID=UPI002DB56654|nr:family 16 glycosylhydrolase [Actinophytocola sp.]HEU5475963.1 family 16 glycosylhydrolase [Actinophytocola sp.]
MALPAPAAGSPPPDAGIAAVTFADEFNGPAGSPVDGSKWLLETGDNVSNHERQWYTNSTRNAAMDGAGNLVITARRENPGGFNCWYGSCQYTSARLNTSGRFTQTYGHFEARIKMSRGQGMWPAFWMLGNNIGSVGWPASGEIDIMENVGFEPRTVHGTLHGPGYSGGAGIGAGFSIPGAFADAFHVFAIDWAPNRITWSVDGTVYQTRTPADLGGNRWVFDHPFFIILNLAVGGFWPGDPDASTVFPQQLLIDYVRVTNDTGGTPPPPPGRTGPITGIGAKCVDVAGANPANGTPVQLWDCNGTNAQRWTLGTDATIRALGKCLDVTSAGTANGTPVQLWDCNGTGAQRWTVTAARDIVNPQANKCLDASNSSSANGTRLQIWTCTGTANQKWTTPA